MVANMLSSAIRNLEEEYVENDDFFYSFPFSDDGLHVFMNIGFEDTWCDDPMCCLRIKDKYGDACITIKYDRSRSEDVISFLTGLNMDEIFDKKKLSSFSVMKVEKSESLETYIDSEPFPPMANILGEDY
jgi:hypothetical protein